MGTLTANLMRARPWRARDIHLADRIFQYSLKSASWLVVSLMVAMVVVVGWMAWPAFERFGWHFFFNPEWDNVRLNFGALSLIHGTLVTSLLALFLATPVAVGVALFLNELAPNWLSRAMGFFVEMLAAIPSVVYGLWGLFVMAPWLRDNIQPVLANHLGWLPFFRGPPLGVGLMAASVVLAVMITPTIAAVAKEIFRSIPNTQREAALGLGATRWEMIRIAVLRSSISGILGATILGLGRALGETMAVTMVIGNRVEINWSLLAAGQSMASLLANQYAEADNDLHLAALTAVGFALFLVSIIIHLLARAVVWRIKVRLSGGRA